MRIYQNFPEAFNEVKRDLMEMGVDVWPKTVHDKKIEDLDAYATKELMNYGYTVVEPKLEEIPTPNPVWCETEWKDRRNGIDGVADLLGTSFDIRKESAGDVITWSDLLEVGMRPIGFGDDPFPKGIDEKLPITFSYSYGERLATNLQVWQVIKRLRVDPESRQLYVSIWDPRIDSDRLGSRRVPCSLGYHFLYRAGALHITYTMRSCELGTHFYNDVWMAMKLLHFVCEQTGLKPGRFTQFINSFHCYRKNLKNVF